jgi:glycolate oxidase FAD binding subunit
MSMASMTASSRLASIVGPAHVIADSLEVAAYEIVGKRPSAAVRPGTCEEVAEVVKFAATEKLAIVPTGARTKLPMGMPPRQYDVALDMTRLDHVTAYDPADMTLGVESGLRLAKLTELLADHNQWLPLAVPYMRDATIGGTISSGVDSAFRQMYGTPRDYVLGMEFVTGAGILAKSGGRVVKNVTGYDLHKLMIGAFGSLGVITKINFRTFPVPISSRGFVANFESADKALELRHRMLRSPLTPLTMEILSPGAVKLFGGEVASRLVREPIPMNLLSNTQWALIGEFSGNEKVLDRCERDFRQMAQECGGASFTVLIEDDIPVVSGRGREFIPIALASTPAATVVKISVLPTRINEILVNAARAAETNALPWAAMARGVGVIYFVLQPSDRGEETRRRVVQASDQILHDSASLGGSATIPWCPAEWKNTLKVWGLDRADFEQMRKLKNLFDSPGILSPGRFAGGL